MAELSAAELHEAARHGADAALAHALWFGVERDREAALGYALRAVESPNAEEAHAGLTILALGAASSCEDDAPRAWFAACSAAKRSRSTIDNSPNQAARVPNAAEPKAAATETVGPSSGQPPSTQTIEGL